MDILMEQDFAGNTSNMSHSQLIDAYNKALALKTKQQSRATDFAMSIADNARSLYDADVDITRPVFGHDRDGTQGGKVWLPGLGKEVSKKQYLAYADKINKGDTKLKQKLGIDWDTSYTTDNTCAAFVCTAVDMAGADTENSDALFFTGKGKNSAEWDITLNQASGGYIDTPDKYDGVNTGYRHSVYKVKKATEKDPDNYTTWDSKEILKDPKYKHMSKKEKLEYARSPEFWQDHLQPGDMIMYYNEENPSRGDHIALAGHDNGQLYHDGHSKHSAQGRGQKEKAHHNTTHSGKHFRIVRYTNHKQIDAANKDFNALETAVNKRIKNDPSFASNWQKGDDGAYAAYTPPPPVKPEPVVAANTIDPVNHKRAQLYKPGFFTKIGNWLRGGNDPDEKDS